MNLHYSQTIFTLVNLIFRVLLPYEFTLLSNSYLLVIQELLCFTTLWIYTTLKHDIL